jgi:membrane-associated phospholipid phosphatase
MKGIGERGGLVSPQRLGNLGSRGCAQQTRIRLLPPGSACAAIDDANLLLFLYCRSSSCTTFMAIRLLGAILFIGLFHAAVWNILEKMAVQKLFGGARACCWTLRPQCACTCEADAETPPPFACYGMPSGHAETATVVLGLCVAHGLMSPVLAFLLWLGICWQRIVSQKHTLLQVAVGAVLGAVYATGYIRFFYTAPA